MEDGLKWIRTCQECGNVQEDVEPTDNKKWDTYRERKCKKCKSAALDYGKWNTPVSDWTE